MYAPTYNSQMIGVTEAELEIVGTKGLKLYEDDDEDKSYSST